MASRTTAAVHRSVGSTTSVVTVPAMAKVTLMDALPNGAANKMVNGVGDGAALLAVANRMRGTG